MNNHTQCPFCNIEREIITENNRSVAIYDGYPVSKGHALIIPKLHCANYFELSLEDQYACITLLNETKNIIQSKYNPDGFNVGININEVAGQTIPHVHIHLIPRYSGDVERPKGGVRGVIPGKKEY